jgi:hypothetical protein
MTRSCCAAGSRPRAPRAPLEPRPSGYESDDDEPASCAGDRAEPRASPAAAPAEPIPRDRGGAAALLPLQAGAAGDRGAPGDASLADPVHGGVGLHGGIPRMHGGGAGPAGAAAPGNAAAANGDAELTLADLDLLEGHHGARALLIFSAFSLLFLNILRRGRLETVPPGLLPGSSRLQLSHLVGTECASPRRRMITPCLAPPPAARPR